MRLLVLLLSSAVKAHLHIQLRFLSCVNMLRSVDSSLPLMCQEVNESGPHTPLINKLTQLKFA